MARAAGIEITETSVRVVELEGSARKHRILGASEIPIGVDDDGQRRPDQVQQAVRSAFKTIRARRDHVVLGLPARKAIIREIVIPFTDPEQISKVIKFESESHLPTANIEDVVVGYHKISESGPRSRLLIIAVQKDTLREYLDILHRQGIDPTQVDLDAAALFSLTRLIPDLDDDDPQSVRLILDVGELNSTFMVSAGAHLRLVRSMRLGAETLTRTLSQDLGIDRLEAQSVTAGILRTELPFTTAGDQEAREPSRALTSGQLQRDIIRDKEQEFVRRIVNEIRRSLSSVQLEGRVRGIWLTGPASTAPLLERELAETFGAPVATLDTLHGSEHSLSPECALYAGVPRGLALKALDHDPLELDFRQEEFKFARKFERLRNPLLFAAAFLLVLFCFLGINQFNEIRFLRDDIQYLARQGQAYFSELIIQRAKGDPKKCSIMGFANAEAAESILQAVERTPPENRVSRMLAELRGPVDHLQKYYGFVLEGDEVSLPPEKEASSALERLDQFFDAFKRAEARLGRWSLDKLDVSSTSISWTMRSDNTNTFTILKEEFGRLPGFESAEAGKIQTRGDMHVYENCRLEFERER